MTIADTVEAYAAEKHLRDFSKLPISEQKRIRAERKKKKKERLAILAKISEYQNQLCDKCKDRQNALCDCSASKAIQDLGKRLGWEAGQSGKPKSYPEIEKPEKFPEDDFRHITPSDFNVKVYKKMKQAKLTDRHIGALLGWYPNKLHQWKIEHNLVKKDKPHKPHKKHAPKSGRPKEEPQKEINGLTVDGYIGYKADSRSDAWISEKYDIPTSTLTRWKRANGVSASTKPQQAVQQPKGEKMMNDVVKLQEPLEVNYKAKYETMKHKCELSYEEIKSQQFYIAELQQQLSDAKESNSEDIQKEIYALTAELNRLKDYEKDYLQLEVDYRNVHTENERLKVMLERLKHTAQINVWLMEQHVGFHKQLDEVVG